MKLHAVRFGFAAAASASICHLIVGLFFYLWPLYSLQISAHLFYLKSLALMLPYVRVTPIIIASSLIQIFVGVFFLAWLMATIYNMHDDQE